VALQGGAAVEHRGKGQEKQRPQGRGKNEHGKAVEGTHGMMIESSMNIMKVPACLYGRPRRRGKIFQDLVLRIE